MLASLVACGGAVSGVDGTSSSGGGSSGGSSSSSGGSSGTVTGSSGGSTSSSSGSSGTANVFDIDLCDGGKEYQPLTGVTPANRPPTAPVPDYLELRDEYENDAYTPPPPGYRVHAQSGTPCASASDKPACETALADARSAGWPVHSYGMDIPRERYLLATVGDTIEFATSIGELREYFSPIDTAKDAALIVTATGQYRVQCGTPQARRTSSGWEVSVLSGHTCGKGTKIEGHVFAVTGQGAMQVLSTTLIEEGDPNCAIGRRPAGLIASGNVGGDRGPLASFFSEAAYLEAASVFAFDRLAEELMTLGAPADLIASALTSREDEVRHARMTKTIARRFGGEVRKPAIASGAGADGDEERTAFEIALENAVEGCVRETFGALVAHWQAQHAQDRSIAGAMRVIAEDETRHAALAWDVAGWLEPRLTAEERRAVDEARERAKRDLRAELAKEVADELVAVAGMPRAAEALALLDALDATQMRAVA